MPLRRWSRHRWFSVTTTGSALLLLRELRTELAGWEAGLVETARAAGASWADLAHPMGVASRQAAENRYLRLRPAGSAGEAAATGAERVKAVRDRRAADRSVESWARTHAADLRVLAARLTALPALAVHHGERARPGMEGHRRRAGVPSAASARPQRLSIRSTCRHLPPIDPAPACTGPLTSPAPFLPLPLPLALAMRDQDLHVVRYTAPARSLPTVPPHGTPRDRVLAAIAPGLDGAALTELARQVLSTATTSTGT
jgi:hypothetical protein